ncbi:unnamed protein product [Adineta steineri]|uniref:Uncharacterized protein n=1 Tax=Adineta steineri TaxID=433720 RepID=A0A814KR08_9BILA|nr:unnamed protein product [Adineta steineri]CAF1352052.1 unnamed protein product [Adineta steineri]
MKVKLHLVPPRELHYCWKTNIQKINHFQQKAEPNEDERLSDVLSFIPDNGLFIYIKIGINGFGLLGQHILRCALQKGIQVVAFNG